MDNPLLDSLRRLICCTVLLLITQTTFAQIVNIENQRIRLRDTTGWFGQVDLGFNLIQNSNRVLSLRGALRVDYLRPKDQWMVIGNYNLIRSNDQDFINDGFSHLRYNYHFNERLTWEAFAQAQYNERIRLRFRGLLGTGPRIKIVKDFFLGVAYMFEYNEVSEGGVIQRDHRMSSYLSFRRAIGSTLTIASMTYYQPVLNDLADLRLSTNTSLQFRISNHLAYTVTFALVYDSRLAREAPGVPSTTYRWTNGLRWNF